MTAAKNRSSRRCPRKRYNTIMEMIVMMITGHPLPIQVNTCIHLVIPGASIPCIHPIRLSSNRWIWLSLIDRAISANTVRLNAARSSGIEKAFFPCCIKCHVPPGCLNFICWAASHTILILCYHFTLNIANNGYKSKWKTRSEVRDEELLIRDDQPVSGHLGLTTFTEKVVNRGMTPIFWESR